MLRRFNFKIIGLLLPILPLVVVVNYYGDAGNLFHTGYEKRAVGIIMSGAHVTNIYNYDERIFQQEFINTKTSRPDVVILGSSRVMLPGTDHFSPQKSIINNAVSGASLEDLIAIYQLYKNRDHLPKQFIIGIDPWLFNENNGQHRWKSLEGAYNQFFNDKTSCYTSKQFIFSGKYAQLWSPSYFQASVKKILEGKEFKLRPTQAKYNKENTKLTDGSNTFNTYYRLPTKKQVENYVQEYLTGSIYNVEHFHSISAKLTTNFKRLVQDMKQNNIEIEFILVPYHPTVYNKLATSPTYQMILKTEEYIYAYAKEQHVKIYGSYNPFKIGLDKSDFLDGMHCNDKGIRKLLLLRDLE